MQTVRQGFIVLVKGPVIERCPGAVRMVRIGPLPVPVLDKLENDEVKPVEPGTGVLLAMATGESLVEPAGDELAVG